MEKKRVVPVWVSVLLVILLLVSVSTYIMFCTKIINAIPVGVSLAIVSSLVSCLCGLFYCFTGYKKDSAKYFKVFCYAYAVFQLILLLLLANSYVLIIPITCLALKFGIACTFCFAENLGKKKSLILASICVLASLIPFLYGIIQSIRLDSFICNLFITIVFFIMVYAKYKDKEARGTK